MDLRTNFGNYKSSDDLTIYFDANKIQNYEMKNLVDKKYNGKMINCEIIDHNLNQHRVVSIPYRRQSLFMSLKHEENGFSDNAWKDQATRWNQLRFHNEVFLNPKLIDEDGLSNLEFIEHSKTHKGKILHINVGV
jgi:hypothetical protein